MRVLVITRNAWDDTNSIGNTMSNFFSGLDDVEFANIYFRGANPNNPVCKKYYQVTEFDVLKYWVFPSKIGKQFDWFGAERKSNTEKKNVSNNEKKIIGFIQKHNLNLVYRFSDYIWHSEKWINKNLKDFVESFSPDIVFTFAKSAPQYYLTVRYLRESYDIPLFSWIADDEYSELLRNGLTKEIKKLEYIINESKILKGCTSNICDYYNNIFNCNASPLYKGCDLSTPIKDYINSPIKIVYAGNLLYGRLDVVKKISEILEAYKGDVSFDIYSNSFLSEVELKCFNSSDYTNFWGARNYDYIKRELSKADLVLHVESFEQKHILKTRYSFSTKIIDCLQSGSALLAIGPKEVASIEYVKQIPGTYVIENLETMELQIKELLANREQYPKCAETIRNFAKEKHSLKNNQANIVKILQSMIKE